MYSEYSEEYEYNTKFRRKAKLDPHKTLIAHRTHGTHALETSFENVREAIGCKLG